MKKHWVIVSIILFISFLLFACSSHSIEEKTLIPELTKIYTKVPMVHPAVTATPDPYEIRASNADEVTFYNHVFPDTWIQDARWSADNQHFAAITRRKLYVYSLSEENEVNIIDFNNSNYCSENTNGICGHAETFAFSPHDNTIAVSASCCVSTIYFIDALSGEILNTITKNVNYLSNIIYSPDGTLLAGIENSPSDHIYIWDVHTGELLHTFEQGHIKAISIAFSPDGKFLVSGGGDPLIRIWDLETGQLHFRMNEIKSGHTLLYSPDGQYILASNYKSISVWNADGEFINNIEIDVRAADADLIAFNPSGDLLAVGGDSDFIQLVSFPDGNLLNKISMEYGDISAMSFSSDGHYLMASTYYEGIIIWTIQLNASKNPMPVPQNNIELATNYSALPYGQYILISTGEEMLAMSQDGKNTYPLTDSLFAYPISADTRTMRVIGDNDALINITDGAFTPFDNSGAYSPNGDWIVDIEVCNYSRAGIEAIRKSTGEAFCISNWEGTVPIQFGEPHTYIDWSPNAQWISIIRISMEENHTSTNETPLPENGLYLMNSVCLEEPDTCKDHISHIHIPYYISYESRTTWAPDSTYFIVNTDTNFFVINTQNEAVWKLPHQVTEGDYPVIFAISPDNRWIAYSSDRTNVLLQPLTNSQPIEIAAGLENIVVLGWITGPYLEIENAYRVLLSGNGVRIREHASLDGKEISKLSTGNTFTVLDGPVQEDGYTWWYIHSDVDDVEGWVSEFYGWYEKIK